MTKGKSSPSMREVLDALDWVRREVLRVNAPDQMRKGIREKAVQRLCARLLHHHARHPRTVR